MGDVRVHGHDEDQHDHGEHQPGVDELVVGSLGKVLEKGTRNILPQLQYWIPETFLGLARNKFVKMLPENLVRVGNLAQFRSQIAVSM